MATDWTGANSQDPTDDGNWSNAQPTSGNDGHIPSGVSPPPQLQGDLTWSCALSIDDGATLDLNGHTLNLGDSLTIGGSSVIITGGEIVSGNQIVLNADWSPSNGNGSGQGPTLLCVYLQLNGHALTIDGTTVDPYHVDQAGTISIQNGGQMAARGAFESPATLSIDASGGASLFNPDGFNISFATVEFFGGGAVTGTGCLGSGASTFAACTDYYLPGNGAWILTSDLVTSGTVHFSAFSGPGAINANGHDIFIGASDIGSPNNQITNCRLLAVGGTSLYDANKAWVLASNYTFPQDAIYGQLVTPGVAGATDLGAHTVTMRTGSVLDIGQTLTYSGGHLVGQAALTARSNMSLSDNFTIVGNLQIQDNVTLDLNGKTLTVADSTVVNLQGKITLSGGAVAWGHLASMYVAGHGELSLAANLICDGFTVSTTHPNALKLNGFQVTNGSGVFVDPGASVAPTGRRGILTGGGL